MSNTLTYIIMTGIVITALALYLWLNRKKYSTIAPIEGSVPAWPPSGWNTQPPQNEGDNTLPPVYIPPTPPAQSTSNADTKNLLGVAGLPRGMKNNNPGNLRISGNAWTGKIPVAQNTDGVFEQFSLYKYGVRAMLKLVRNYITNGHNTIAKIINRYAPDVENHTTNYINFIVQKTGINPYAPLTANNYAMLEGIIIAMANFENGRADAVTQEDFYTAWNIQ